MRPFCRQQPMVGRTFEAYWNLEPDSHSDADTRHACRCRHAAILLLLPQFTTKAKT